MEGFIGLRRPIRSAPPPATAIIAANVTAHGPWLIPVLGVLAGLAVAIWAQAVFRYTRKFLFSNGSHKVYIYIYLEIYMNASLRCISL